MCFISKKNYQIHNRLMETYEMRSMFTLNMEGLQLRLYQFQSLLKEILPDLAQYLDKHGVHAAMYASQWFLTLFAYGFPITLVARIYDIIFAEGAAETIMRVAIAMLKRSQEQILHDVNPEFEDILDYVTSRKLCDPYTDNYGNVVRDAMALSGIITRDKMDRLSEEYNQRTIDGQQEQVVLAATAGRIGFWKRRNRYNSIKPDMRRSASAGGTVTDNSALPAAKPIVSKPPTLKKRWSSVSLSPRDWTLNNTAPTNSFNSDVEYATKLEQTMQELEELKKAHQKTLDDLLEVQYDKQDLACERDALKLTITELERSHRSDKRDYCDSPIILPARSFSDLTVANNKDASSSVFTRSSSSITSSRKNSIHVSSSSTTMLTLISNSNKSYDSNEYDRDLYIPTSENLDQELSSQLVHIKVRNFELEQQCEKLSQDFETVQSKFDMVNEGQMVLVHKLVSMKTEMDDIKTEMKEKELAYLDLQKENQELRLELNRAKDRFLALSKVDVISSQQAGNVRRHSTTSLSLANLENMRIRNLEVSLTAHKIKLAEHEFVQTLASHPSGKKKSSIYGRVLQAFSKTSVSSNNVRNATTINT